MRFDLIIEETVTNLLSNARNNFRSDAIREVNQIMSILLRRIQRAASLKCHSLSDLARLGHPYSPYYAPTYEVKPGISGWRTRNYGKLQLHLPPDMIHSQSGEFLSSLKIGGRYYHKFILSTDSGPKVHSLLLGRKYYRMMTGRNIGYFVGLELFQTIYNRLKQFFINRFRK